MDLHISSRDVFGKADFRCSTSARIAKMQVNSIDNQTTLPGQTPDGQNAGTDPKPRTQPAVYDTSKIGKQSEEPAEIYSGKPPPGLNVGTRFKLDENGHFVYVGYFPVINGRPEFLKGPPPADKNVGTVFKLDDKGNPLYVGYFELPKKEPGDKHVDTPLDVFWRGFKSGATHPAQTIGKMIDDQNGDKDHRAETTGKKIDGVLEKLPFTSDAIVITQAIAGETNPDGSPKLPQPNVGPHVDEVTSGGNGKTSPKTSPQKDPIETKKSEPGANVTKSPPDAKLKKTESLDNSKHIPNTSSEASAQFTVPKEYARAPNGGLKANNDFPGVFQDDKGNNFVQAGNQNWPVRYDKDNGTWRVYNPDNAAKPQYPVQLDEHGDWQVHNNVGLKGGNPGDGNPNGNPPNNRDKLDKVVGNSPTGEVPGSYPNSVKIVNDLLQRLHINLSNQSADTIINNVKQVDSGQMAHGRASAREVWTFARDVADPKLPMKDRAAAALGMVLNGIAGPAYMAQFDLQNYHFGTNQSADLRQAMHMFAQFDPQG
jgi:hypothetical protein